MLDSMLDVFSLSLKDQNLKSGKISQQPAADPAASSLDQWQQPAGRSESGEYREKRAWKRGQRPEPEPEPKMRSGVPSCKLLGALLAAKPSRYASPPHASSMRATNTAKTLQNQMAAAR